MPSSLIDLTPTLLAIVPSAVSQPDKSIEIYLGKCDVLLSQAQADRDVLSAAPGFNGAYIDTLPARIGALREAEAAWENVRFSGEAARTLWKTKSPAAFKLRDDLLHSFAYIFRKNPSVLATVASIADGSGNDDMLLDLTRLSDLGKAQHVVLQAVKFDMTLLSTATRTADDLSKILADTRNETVAGGSKAKDLRDRAFTYCNEAVEEIRTCGKFVFYDNREKRSHYYNTNPKTSKAKPTPVEGAKS